MLRAFTRAGIAQRCVETAEELQKLVMRDMADNESREEQSHELQGYEAIARTQRGPNRPKTHIEKAKFPILRRTFVYAQFSGRELAGAETLFRCARERERVKATPQEPIEALISPCMGA